MMFAALALALLQADTSEALPPAIVQQLPQGYEMLHSAHAVFGTPVHDIYIVALGRQGETRETEDAQPRPLLIYELRAGAWVLTARNDHVVLQVDEGGQCDPFEGGGITAKGAWFTVENSVACGNHWTDYITFRFDARLGYVFDNQRYESWSFNPSNAPDAEALISDGMHVTRAVKGHLVRFADWRDSDS
jgi:hypothetical protein